MVRSHLVPLDEIRIFCSNGLEKGLTLEGDVAGHVMSPSTLGVLPWDWRVILSYEWAIKTASLPKAPGTKRVEGEVDTVSFGTCLFL